MGAVSAMQGRFSLAIARGLERPRRREIRDRRIKKGRCGVVMTTVAMASRASRGSRASLLRAARVDFDCYWRRYSERTGNGAMKSLNARALLNARARFINLTARRRPAAASDETAQSRSSTAMNAATIP